MSLGHQISGPFAHLHGYDAFPNALRTSDVAETVAGNARVPQEKDIVRIHWSTRFQKSKVQRPVGVNPIAIPEHKVNICDSAGIQSLGYTVSWSP